MIVAYSCSGSDLCVISHFHPVYFLSLILSHANGMVLISSIAKGGDLEKSTPKAQLSESKDFISDSYRKCSEMVYIDAAFASKTFNYCAKREGYTN